MAGQGGCKAYPTMHLGPFRGAILWNTLPDSIKSLALRDQSKSGRVTIAHVKYVDKESVGILPEVYLYIIIS